MKKNSVFNATQRATSFYMSLFVTEQVCTCFFKQTKQTAEKLDALLRTANRQNASIHTLSAKCGQIIIFAHSRDMFWHQLFLRQKVIIQGPSGANCD